MAASSRHIEPLLPVGVAQTVSINDTLSLADSATPVKPLTASPADSVVLSDALTIAWVQDRAGDTVTLSDSTSEVVGKARTLADTLSLADSTSRLTGVGRSPADTLALADALAKARGIAVADALGEGAYSGGAYGAGGYSGTALSDLLSRVVTSARTVSDTVALTDALGRGYAKPFADSVALADSITPLLVRNVSVNDAVTVDDLFARVAVYARTPADALDLADQALDAQGIQLPDLVALADAIAQTRGVSFADALALAEQFSRAVVYLRSVADALVLSDSVSLEKSSANALNINDSVALSDAFSRVATANRTVADSLTLADLLSESKVLALALVDSVTTDDVFNRVASYVRTPADALTLSDQRTFGAIRAFADLVGMADDQVVRLISLSTILGAVYTGRIAMGENGDNDAPEQGEISDTVGGVIEEELVEV